MQAIDDFIDTLSTKATMHPVAAASIVEVEQQLGRTLPQSYRYLLTRYGLVHTANLFTERVAIGSSLPASVDFFSPADVINLTPLYQSMGLPNSATLFAASSDGSLFYFDDQNGEPAIDCPVWHYHPHNGQYGQQHPLFSQWLISLTQQNG